MKNKETKEKITKDGCGRECPVCGRVICKSIVSIYRKEARKKEQERIVDILEDLYSNVEILQDEGWSAEAGGYNSALDDAIKKINNEKQKTNN